MENENMKDDVPASEAVERPWASNDKLTYDETLKHVKRIDVVAEMALSDMVNYRTEMHDQKLRHEEELHKQKMEHEDQLFKEKLENNRYTLDRLYSVFTEESTSLSLLLKAAAEAMGFELVEKK